MAFTGSASLAACGGHWADMPKGVGGCGFKVSVVGTLPFDSRKEIEVAGDTGRKDGTKTRRYTRKDKEERSRRERHGSHSQMLKRGGIARDVLESLEHKKVKRT